jgi:hypothetical protein
VAGGVASYIDACVDWLTTRAVQLLSASIATSLASSVVGSGRVFPQFFPSRPDCSVSEVVVI